MDDSEESHSAWAGTVEWAEGLAERLGSYSALGGSERRTKKGKECQA